MTFRATPLASVLQCDSGVVNPLWTIVLAAGAGRRLAPVTGGVPKQFWHHDGVRSLLESTLHRVAPLTTPDRTVIVVDATHGPYVGESPDVGRRGRVLFQPFDRGTAPGVLLPLTAVIEAAPEAIVLLTPSDHGIGRSSHFRAGVRDAVARIQSGQTEVVLFGVEPRTPNGDYGWISPSRASNGPLRRVAGFVEKPPYGLATQLFRSGAVWNTMVLVARAAALFNLYRTHLPQVARVFARALRVPEEARGNFLAEHYQSLPASDFSCDVLASARGLSLYTWPDEMGWSDLGTPERLEQWMSGAAGGSVSHAQSQCVA